MSFSEELIEHAIKLLGNPSPPANLASNADLRRVVSSAYYGLFHHLIEAAVEQIAPHAPVATANRIHRWFEHAEMKKICREFAAKPLKTSLRELLGDLVSLEMQTVAINFIRLQEARHSADYDLGYQLNWQEAREFVEMSVNAIGAWNRICPSLESNIFVLSLLLWKKWEVIRP